MSEPAITRFDTRSELQAQWRALREGLAALVKDAVRTVVDRDPGGMRLDERKGLIGPEVFRRRPKSKGPKAGVKSLRVLND